MEAIQRMKITSFTATPRVMPTLQLHHVQKFVLTFKKIGLVDARHSKTSEAPPSFILYVSSHFSGVIQEKKKKER